MTSPLIMRSNNSQEGVLAWVSERLAVAMRQAEDLILRDYIVSAALMLAQDKSSLIDLELLVA